MTKLFCFTRNLVSWAFLVCCASNSHAHELTKFEETFYGFFNGIAGEPFSATIVDAETKEPIEGAVALIHWDTIGGHGQVTGFVEMLEAKSDKNGRLYFPAWGPKLAWITDVTLRRNPKIHLFKAGYEPGVLIEESVTIKGVQEINRLHLTSSWNEKIIGLMVTSSTPLEYRKTMLSFMRNLDSLFFEEIGVCYWIEFPFLRGGMDEFAAFFREHKLGRIELYDSFECN
tara:strand:+ start:69 stop:755 length:687 start_codon:yes stop_codon:yes gene_type:complete